MKNKKLGGGYLGLFLFVTAPFWVIFIIVIIWIARGCS